MVLFQNIVLFLSRLFFWRCPSLSCFKRDGFPDWSVGFSSISLNKRRLCAHDIYSRKLRTTATSTTSGIRQSHFSDCSSWLWLICTRVCRTKLACSRNKNFLADQLALLGVALQKTLILLFWAYSQLLSKCSSSKKICLCKQNWHQMGLLSKGQHCLGFKIIPWFNILVEVEVQNCIIFVFQIQET